MTTTAFSTRTGSSPQARECASEDASAVEATPSFDEVYRAHVDFLWRSARGFGISESGVQDILQDVFIVVHRRLPEYEGARGIRTWLARILHRVVLQHRRRFRRKEDHDELPAELGDPDAAVDPRAAVARKQAAALLMEVLDAMRDDQRDVFVLAEMEGVPVPEIAEALELSVNTVYSRLRLARREYQRQVDRLRARELWRS